VKEAGRWGICGAVEAHRRISSPSRDAGRRERLGTSKLRRLSPASLVLALSIPCLSVTFPFGYSPALSPGLAYADPLDSGAAAVSDRLTFTFSYSREQKRLRTAVENVQREVLEGGARLHLKGPLGLWARVKGSGPWGDDGTARSLTDLEFGPRASSGLWRGRVDAEAWLLLAAPAGNEPEGDIWYQGLESWSLGVGGSLGAGLLGGSGATPIRGSFDISYRGSGRSGWVYLPRHSVALADTADVLGGGTMTFQAELEFRGDRATLSTGLLWEEPIGAGQIMALKERPIYVVQRAALRAWKSASITAGGEVLLSGDDPRTEFKVVSLVPRWSAYLGVGWGFTLAKP